MRWSRPGKRRFAFALAIMAVIGAVSATAAFADTTIFYFDPPGGPYACCTHREFSPYYVYATANAASDSSSSLCIQELVYPASGGSFYDGYECHAPGTVSHFLNGENVDQTICWANSSSNTIMSCAENYR